jgi:predicted CXXCH cytochrome family protein
MMWNMIRNRIDLTLTLVALAVAGVLLSFPAVPGTDKSPPPDGPGEGSCMEAGCHGDLADGLVVHGAVAGEACDACHEHTGQKHLFKMTAETTGEICAACHDDPREAGSNVHGAAAEGECTSCHDPHESDHGGLLVAEGGELCTTCHEDPAASGEVVHAPAGAGMCVACHDPHASDLGSLLLAEGNDLCLTCHDDPKAAGDVVHPPVEEGECTMCHAPHASDHPYMTREAATDLCLGCHDAQGEEIAGPVVHGVIKELGCPACHDPHASPHARMLRRAGNGLCLECHLTEPDAGDSADSPDVRLLGSRSVPAATLAGYPKIALKEGLGHPNVKHPVAGESNPMNPEAPFWCGSCHVPHGSEKPGLLIGKSGMSLCFQCHKK